MLNAGVDKEKHYFTEILSVFVRYESYVTVDNFAKKFGGYTDLQYRNKNTKKFLPIYSFVKENRSIGSEIAETAV